MPIFSYRPRSVRVALAALLLTGSVRVSAQYLITDLGTLGGLTSSGYGLNALGQAAGSSIDAVGDTHAFRTAPNAAIHPPTDDPGTLGGLNSFGRAIDAAGRVAGSSDTGTATHAFRTAPNAAINPLTDDLGTLGVLDSFAYGIDAAGHVAGAADTNTGDLHAFLFDGVTLSDLSTLGGLSSEAFGINGQDQVVGDSRTASNDLHAFVFKNGMMMDLNSLIPGGSGWVLVSATAINDSGQIVGFGMVGGDTHAFLLTPGAPPPPPPPPVPEPGALSLLVGMAVFGLAWFAPGHRRAAPSFTQGERK